MGHVTEKGKRKRFFENTFYDKIIFTGDHLLQSTWNAEHKDEIA